MRAIAILIGGMLLLVQDAVATVYVPRQGLPWPQSLASKMKPAVFKCYAKTTKTRVLVYGTVRKDGMITAVSVVKPAGQEAFGKCLESAVAGERIAAPDKWKAGGTQIWLNIPEGLGHCKPPFYDDNGVRRFKPRCNPSVSPPADTSAQPKATQSPK